MKRQDGYTLIELTIAMTIFSFMLLIIMAGFVSIVRLHNASVATNVVQDNAQTLMATLERMIRDGTRITLPSANSMCVDDDQLVYVSGGNLQQVAAASCAPVLGATPSLLSTAGTQVFDFAVSNLTPSQTRPTIGVSLTVGANNGTVSGVGAAATCNGGSAVDRQFCAVSTVTSAATPRGLDGGSL